MKLIKSINISGMWVFTCSSWLTCGTNKNPDTLSMSLCITSLQTLISLFVTHKLVYISIIIVCTQSNALVSIAYDVCSQWKLS